MRQFNNLYNLIMEGLRSGYPFGKMEKTELEKRFSLSYAYCLKNLKKELIVNLSIHSMSIKKGHGLHKIPFSHAKTFKKLDEAIFIILQDASDQKLFECIFKEKNLMISFEKFWNDKKIQINVINAFLLNKMQYKLRLETEFHIDEKGSKFKVIKMS